MPKMKTLFTISCFMVLSLSNFAQKNISVPFEKWISLKQVGGVKLSPDGKNILYTVTSTQWNENGYDSEIWLSRNGQRPFQLTNTVKGSSNAGSFSPDNKWVSFLADRGNKTQIYLISIDGGEAFVITDE